MNATSFCKPPVVTPIESVTVTFTRNEALALLSICGAIGGQGESRDATNAFYNVVGAEFKKKENVKSIFEIDGYNAAKSKIQGEMWLRP